MTYLAIAFLIAVVAIFAMKDDIRARLERERHDAIWLHSHDRGQP